MPSTYRYTIHYKSGSGEVLAECTECRNDLNYVDADGDGVRIVVAAKDSPETINAPGFIDPDGWLRFGASHTPARGDFVSIECSRCGLKLADMDGVTEEQHVVPD